MNARVRFVRRNRVNEPVAVVVAASGAVVTVQAGVSPTGSTVIDVVVVALSAFAVIWASASAPWWAGACAAGTAACLALEPGPAIVGAVGFVAGLVVGLVRRDNSATRAVVGALAVNALARSDLDGFFGLSSVVGLTVCAALLVLGLRRRRSMIRRPAWIGIGVVGGMAALAILALAVSVAAARPGISRGAESARSALDALDAGDYDGAAELFDDAAARFESVGEDLGGATALPSRFVPVVSQNARAGADIADVAASGLEQAAVALREVDPTELVVEGGVIDLDAVRAVEAPLMGVQVALEDLQQVTGEVRSPWLLPQLADELDELDEALDRQAPRLDHAIDAVRLAPQLLGGEGERTYLVLFTSPAEARGLGGFVGNYAEVRIDDGRIEVGTFARRSELEAIVREADVRCSSCAAEFLERYGRFGFTSGENGGVGDRAWSNITMPAHFPYVAEAAASLYPQSGGRDLDGVIVMDPYVVQALMAYTGPIDVPELGVTVRPEDAAQFILEDQYVLAAADATGAVGNEERIDALETLGEEVISRLLTGALPEPASLAGDLAPLVEERRLMFWARDADERALLGEVGMLGSLPTYGDDGGFSVSVTNAGASKIDVFLERSVSTRIDVDPDGERRLVAEVTLTNGAPTADLPDYMIGNSVGLPVGSSRLWVTFYGPPSLGEIVLDGEPIAVEPLTEAGWGAFGHYLTLSSGQSASYVLEFALPPDPRPGGEPDIVTFRQPLADRVDG